MGAQINADFYDDYPWFLILSAPSASKEMIPPFDPLESVREAVMYVAGKYEEPLEERQFPQGMCIQYTCFSCHIEVYTVEQHAREGFDDILDNCTACHPAGEED